MAARVEADRTAILRLIEDETTAYFNKDYQGWARCWVHAPYVRRFGWYSRFGRVVHLSWEEESSVMKSSMEQYPAPNRSIQKVLRENLSIRVGKDMAWVTFEQIAPKTGDPFDVPGRQHEGRILEKHEGEWKIACSFVLGSPLEFVGSPLLCVDEKSNVIWMNFAATEQINQHQGLTVSGGRLRALSRGADQRLQASIRWAAGVRSYFSFQAVGHVTTARYGAVPVLLGDSDEAVRDICWVFADSGMILVSFNDPHTTELRLEAAAIIYGITPAQRRLAGLIVAGCDLVEAARHLGVSVNTARTHLQRMFDKTGVRSQPALVRALLSAVTPLT